MGLQPTAKHWCPCSSRNISLSTDGNDTKAGKSAISHLSLTVIPLWARKQHYEKVVNPSYALQSHQDRLKLCCIVSNPWSSSCFQLRWDNENCRSFWASNKKSRIFSAALLLDAFPIDILWWQTWIYTFCVSCLCNTVGYSHFMLSLLIISASGGVLLW